MHCSHVVIFRHVQAQGPHEHDVYNLSMSSRNVATLNNSPRSRLSLCAKQ